MKFEDIKLFKLVFHFHLYESGSLIIKLFECIPNTPDNFIGRKIFVKINDFI